MHAHGAVSFSLNRTGSHCCVSLIPICNTVDSLQALVTCNGSFVAPLSANCSAILALIRSEFIYLNPYNVEVGGLLYIYRFV